jgi:hypothetical protein
MAVEAGEEPEAVLAEQLRTRAFTRCLGALAVHAVAARLATERVSRVAPSLKHGHAVATAA